MEKQPNSRNLAERISAFIEARGLKRKDFAAVIGITYDGLQSYLQAKAEPPRSFWQTLKEKYPDADLEFLMFGIKKEEPNIDMEMQREVFKVPVVSEIPAGGFTRSFEDLISEEHTYTTIKRPGTFALRVKGDSMKILIEPGDLVILTPDVIFENGKVYAIIAGDSEATLKRVFREDDILRLVPENKKYKETRIQIADVIKLYRVARIEKAP